MLRNEVGNLSELLDAHQRDEFNALLTEAFAKAGASEHGNPLIIWINGETVADARAEIASDCVAAPDFQRREPS